MNLPSKYLENAVDAFASLPGIGKRTALRLTLHLLKKDKGQVLKFADTFKDLILEVKSCKKCHNLSDQEICSICQSPKRDTSLICVVEDIRDILAIESTQQYRGIYHVLGGLISPMDGVGPNDLTITHLEARVKSEQVNEVILALSATMEGDTTNFYLYRKLNSLEVKISTIARGIGIGDELEYTDEITLGKSILNRLPFENSLTN
jgi:recombination protein RecR